MVTLIVKKERVGPIRGRHPWVFSGALKNIPEGLTSGEPVVLHDEQGNFLAQGFFNSYSQIAVRIWSWDKEEMVDAEFFEKRLKRAYELRKDFVANTPSPLQSPSGRGTQTNAYRLIHAENDLLPGLIVDKYAEYLSVQFHNPGIEHWKDLIVKALVKILKPKGIYERSDVGRRTGHSAHSVISTEAKRSGEIPPGQTKGFLDFARNDNEKVGLLFGEVPERVKIKENGYLFWVDIIGGQKTGFFLDQRDKRLALQKYVMNKKVLNCFSYTGGFSVYALGAGAKSVVSVDASQPALELAEENVKLNKLDESKCEFILADVKEYLTDCQSGEFDVIILDPPAFVKDRHKIKEGLQGYRKINEMALRILPPGGILLTCSCSAHVRLEDFRFMLSEAAARAGRTVQVLETFTHGIDHPELAAFTEGEYLKCVFAKVL
ncbi:MAG: class I SAM-dependent rRNA methyltransferase [Candidatus Magasanikbacteria bacterium]|nr:class I SAM-dependent rRNA methyltransferase [Candidatus Magasanikbacteria bacterium]